MKCNLWRRHRRELLCFALTGACTCLSLIWLFPREQNSSLHIQQATDPAYLQVYLMDEDRLLVPLAIACEENDDSRHQIEVMLEYLSGKQPLAGFESFFTQEDVVDTIQVEEGCATLNFNERFLSYDAENELRLLEAIVWGATQFADVEQVVLQLDGVTLTNLPLANTPITQPLTRAIGINHFETSSATLHDSVSLLVYGTKKIEGTHYLIPRSRRVDAASSESLAAQAAAVMADLSASGTLASTMEEHALKVEVAQEGIIDLTLDQSIFTSDLTLKEDDINELVLSLCALSEVEGVRLHCEEDSVGCEIPQLLTNEQLQYNIIEPY